MICEFLLFLFKKGYVATSLNVARNAISFFLSYCMDFATDSGILRLFKYFYRMKPSKPKYLTYWPIAKLLNFLAEWHPIHCLSLKQLTLKTAALIALSSSDRGQTIQLLNIENTHLSEEAVTFERLKTTKRNSRPHEVKCLTSDTPSLNVCDYVMAYMNRTIAFREKSVSKGLGNPTQLFLSWSTHRPVTKATIASWLTTTLAMAGIDTSQFKAHSYRSAGLSMARSKGATISQIMTAGNWTNAKTFNSFYNAPADDTPVGQMILNHLQHSVSAINIIYVLLLICAIRYSC